MFRKSIKFLRGKSGLATSLLEATATIAVGATLAGAAVTVVTDKIQDARIAQAQQDVQSLADAINTFEKDTTFFPIFKTSGNSDAAASTSDPNPDTAPFGAGRLASELELLISRNGDFSARSGNAATDGSKGQVVKNWATSQPSGRFDTFESQLIENGPKYTVKGSIKFDKNLGFAGPYLSSLASTDPWGNKYQCNVVYLNDRFLIVSGTGEGAGQSERFQTLVISAGPNEEIQTSFEAKADAGVTTGKKVTVQGDDIAYSVR